MFPAGLRRGNVTLHTCAALPTPSRSSRQGHSRVALQPNPLGTVSGGPGGGGISAPRWSRRDCWRGRADRAPRRPPRALGPGGFRCTPHCAPLRSRGLGVRGLGLSVCGGRPHPFPEQPYSWSGEFLTTGVTGSPGAFALEAPQPRSPRVSPGEPSPGHGGYSARTEQPARPGAPSLGRGSIKRRTGREPGPRAAVGGVGLEGARAGAARPRSGWPRLSANPRPWGSEEGGAGRGAAHLALSPPIYPSDSRGPTFR